MKSLVELKKAREKKLEAVKKEGLDPYPAKTNRTHSLEKALADFKILERNKERVVLAGRIISVRGHGGSTFLTIKDATTNAQVYLKRDELGEGDYDLFKNFDIGDFIEVEGTFFITQKGEKTLLAKSFRMLSKSLRPLPEKWKGLKDRELRYRRRYLDLLTNEKSRDIFIKRSKIIDALRDFLTDNEYIEVETPTLQEVAGGALAKPFKTRLEAQRKDYYLRIAPELYLKRLLVGGLEKVFEVAKAFRNEGFSTKHNPEYTLLEIYTAYFDYKDVMKLTEDLLKYTAKKVFGGLTFSFKGKKIDLGKPWTRVTLRDAIKKETGLDIDKFKAKEALVKELKKRKIKLDFTQDRGKIIDKLFETKVEEKLTQPTFVTDIPRDISPLAKSLEDGSDNTQRFELFIAGMEMANAYSELNDPREQEERFKEQLEKREVGDEEAHEMDKDFVETLEYGMPPAGGLGFGVDRLVMIFTDAPSIRDVVLFPSLKSKEWDKKE